MAKFYVGKGLEDYIEQLKELEVNSTEMIERAVYEGAGFLADEVKKSIDQIPITNKRGSEDNKIDGITSDQRKGLKEGLGISPMQNSSGFVNVKIGFDGYNKTKTDKYPSGQPNVLIARSLESGTTFRKRRQFVTKTARKNKKKVEELMQQRFDTDLTQIYAIDKNEA